MRLEAPRRKGRCSVQGQVSVVTKVRAVWSGKFGQDVKEAAREMVSVERMSLGELLYYALVGQVQGIGNRG